jgi:hypothetical protein
MQIAHAWCLKFGSSFWAGCGFLVFEFWLGKVSDEEGEVATQETYDFKACKCSQLVLPVKGYLRT